MAHRDRLAAWCCLALAAANAAMAQTVHFDFSWADTVRQWRAANHVSSVAYTRDGMRIAIAGNDPYIFGPARTFPAAQRFLVTARVWSATPGFFELFWFADGESPVQSQSVRLPVSQGGVWQTVQAALPALPSTTRLRLDPPGTRRHAIVRSLTVEALPVLPAARWTTPDTSVLTGGLAIRSGSLTLRHGGRFGQFDVRYGDQRVLIGIGDPQIACANDSGPRWIGSRQSVVYASGSAIVSQVTLADGAAAWRLQQRFTPGRNGEILVDASLTALTASKLHYAPLMLVSAFSGPRPYTRQQGLFPGLEYLDEPDTSSSEADIRGPGSWRLAPDQMKVTIPMSVVQTANRWTAMSWQPGDDVCAVFDSPDRVFHSTGHLQGVVAPGGDAINRTGRTLWADAPLSMKRGQTVRTRCVLKAGVGASVVPALQWYIGRNGLPALPPAPSRSAYARSAAAGWLDSGLAAWPKCRHAYYPDSPFHPAPAIDPAVYLRWLQTQPLPAARKRAIARVIQQVVPSVASEHYLQQTVSHIRPPVAPLLFGDVGKAVAAARDAGHGLLSRFNEQGRVIYQAAPGQEDQGVTHFADHANGLTAPLVEQLLKYAMFSGDRELRTRGLALLDALMEYDNTVPRGAQTWECPLHVPDILASAHLVKAFVMGYQLTGETRYLDRAKYWAWTGVPFIYLRDPASGPIGRYGSIAVFGSTMWDAVNWMGLPVQWCGMVYADALYDLAPLDGSGPWKRLADGITISGMQQNEPLSGRRELAGLLPDSFEPRSQTRNPVFINPGTIQSSAACLYTGVPLFSAAVSRQHGAIVNAPGTVRTVEETRAHWILKLQLWPAAPARVLISGLHRMPRSINGRPVRADEIVTDGVLAIRMTGTGRLRLSW